MWDQQIGRERGVAVVFLIALAIACGGAGDGEPVSGKPSPDDVLINGLTRREVENRLQAWDRLEAYKEYVKESTIRFGGIDVVQLPSDIWAHQEIIHDVKPDFVIETGTYKGGSTLYFAAALELLGGEGRVISVDIEPKTEDAEKYDVWQRRVKVITGDSVAASTIEQIAADVEGHSAFVTLDSFHGPSHVAKELELYSPFVTPGSYIIVQDTYFGLAGVIEAFLAKHPEFEIDTSWESRYLISKHRRGFLKRVR